MADKLNTLGTEPDDTEIKSVMEAIEKAKRQAATPSDQTEMNKAEEEAQRLYEERANRADWIGLADRIGNALTRYGAATSGIKSGVDMTQINYGPGYDVGAAQNQAAKQYDMSLGRIGRQRAAGKEATAAQQAQLDREADALKPRYDFEKYRYGQKTDTIQQSLRDDSTFKRTQAAQKAQEERDAKRAMEREERDTARAQAAEEKQLRSLNATDLQKQISSAAEEAAAASQASQILATQKDLSKKNADKLVASYPQVMAKAGINPEQMASIQERATEKGWIWDSIDEKKRQQLIQEELIKPKREKLQNLRNALDAVLQKRKEVESPEPATTEETPAAAPSAPPGMVTMKSPDGKIGNIPEQKAAEAEAKGFTRVQ